MLLATDLDGTFLGGTPDHKEQLYSLIDKNNVTLVFVTGRGVANIYPLFVNNAIPRPAYIIADVGATVVYGNTFEQVEEVQSAIKSNWPGSSEVLQHFKDIEWLQYQPVPQQRRCSFYLKDETKLPLIAQMAAEINCDVIYSAGKFLDVLPKGVNKGTTLVSLLNHLQVDDEKVLVAGDTLNDLAMYHCGFNSVAVGDAEDGLLNATAGMENVYHAEAAGAGGILEAIAHFNMWQVAKTPLNIV